MADFVHHAECDTLIATLRPQAAKAYVKTGYWITEPDGSVYYTDRGAEWCYTCGAATLLELRVNDPENADEYILDGGWRTEHDTPPMCAGCGHKIDATLLTYGGLYELDHFREHAPDPSNINHCYEVSEMLAALSYTDEQHTQEAAEAIGIAKAMLAKAALPSSRATEGDDPTQELIESDGE